MNAAPTKLILDHAMIAGQTAGAERHDRVAGSEGARGAGAGTAGAPRAFLPGGSEYRFGRFPAQGD